MVSRMQRGNSTPEENQQRRIAARRRFRAIVKLIIANLSWLQDVEDDKLGDNVKKNIQLLTRKKGKKSILSVQDKTILNKPDWARTTEEKTRIRRIVSTLKCFRQYPSEIKNELPSILNFAFFSANRIIIKQGYEALNLYVILTGEVVVSQTSYNKLLKKEVSKDVMVMGPGNIFGEVALLHDIQRQATVTTTVPSELLYVRRDDFDRVLKDTIAKEWAEIRHNLSWFSYFQGWSPKDILETCIVAKKRRYIADQLILSNTGGDHDSVYLITKGLCHLIEYMTVRTIKVKGIPYYILIEDSETHKQDRVTAATVKDIKSLYKKEESHIELTPQQQRHSLRPVISVSRPSLLPSFVLPETKTHFIRVCTYKKLACFNVGEDMKNRVVVAATDTECLVIPRFFVFEKNMQMFTSIKNYLLRHIPNTHEVFKNFLEEKKWTLYKKRLMQDILTRKKIVVGNNIHNVPYTIRLQEYFG